MLKRSTWVLLAIFAVVLITALIYQRYQSNVKADATPTSVLTYLVDTTGNQIIAMEVNSADGRIVAFERSAEGNWVLTEPAEEEADSARIDSMVSQAATLRVLSRLEVPLELDVMGLDQPEYWIALTLADGEQKIVYIGDSTPTESGYYAFVGGGPIQIVNKSSVDSVLDILNNPPILITPTVSSEE